jgi:hypothetical protein
MAGSLAQFQYGNLCHFVAQLLDLYQVPVLLLPLAGGADSSISSPQSTPKTVTPELELISATLIRVVSVLVLD